MGIATLLKNPQLLITGMLPVAALILGALFFAREISVRQHINSGKLIAVLISLFGLGLYAYFMPGDMLGGDADSHLARTWFFNNILREERSFPFWTNRWYFGYPLGQYYGFLYYLTGGLASLMFENNVVLTTKCLLWFLHVLSGIGMFFYVKLLAKSVPDNASTLSAFFAAAFYVFSFQHVGMIMRSGALQTSLIFLLLPVLFICFELFYSSLLSLVSSCILTALVLSLLVFVHIQYGFYCVTAFFFMAVIRYLLICFFGKNSSHSFLHLKFLIFVALFFLLCSSWFIVPMILEKKYLVMSDSVSIKGLLGHFSFNGLKRAANMFLWSRRRHDWVIYYVGLVPLSIAFLAAIYHQKRKDIVFWSYCVSFWAGFVFLLSSPRFAIIWFFFACVLSAYGVLKISTYSGALFVRNRRYLFSALMALLLLDIGPTLIQQPYRILNNSKISYLQEQLKKQGETGRIFLLGKKKSTLWQGINVIGTDASSVFGAIPQAATKTYPYVAAIACKAAMEIIDNGTSMSDTTCNALRLLNIKYMLIPSAKAIQAIHSAYPAWFSQQLKRSRQEAGLLENATWDTVRYEYEKRMLDYSITDKIVSEMELDSSLPVAGYILMHNMYSSAEVDALNLSSTPENKPSFVIDEVMESHYTFKMNYRCSTDGFVRISYSYFPFNKASIDGKVVTTYRSAANFIIVPVQQGDHCLTITPGLSRLRVILLYIAMISIILSACCLAVKAYRYYQTKRDAKGMSRVARDAGRQSGTSYSSPVKKKIKNKF